MTENIGSYRVEVDPTDLTMTVMGDGSTVVRLKGKNAAKLEDATLTATLFELARSSVPGLELLDLGPGLGALRERLEASQRLLGEAQTLSAHLADAESKVRELDEELSAARAANDSLAASLLASASERTEKSARIAELEQQLREAEAANVALSTPPVEG